MPPLSLRASLLVAALLAAPAVPAYIAGINQYVPQGAVGFTPGQADGVLAGRKVADEANAPSSRFHSPLLPFRPRKPEDAAAYVPGVTRLSPALLAGAAGFADLTGDPLLSRAIVRLRQQVPQVLVRLSEQPPRHLIARLMDGELDCVVAPLPPETLGSEDALQLRLEKIMSDRLCVVASPKHPLAKAKKLHWRDLAKESWVLSPPDALTRQRFMGACLEHGITPPNPVIECISFAPIQWLLRSDASLLALMRHYQVADDAALGLISVLPVSPGVQLPDVSLITRRDGAGYPDAVAGLLAELRYSVRNVV